MAMAIIVKKTWKSGKHPDYKFLPHYFNEGYFLFGFIPLYINRVLLNYINKD